MTAAEAAARDRLRELAGEADGPMERHCLRVFEIARELGRRGGGGADEELLFVAAMLHDAGIYRHGRNRSYVRDSRTLAQETGRAAGWEEARVVLLADAVEHHHELRAQWERGTEVELLRRADLVDLAGSRPIRFGLDRAWLAGLRGRISGRGRYRHIGALVARHPIESPRGLLAIFRP